MIRLLLIFISSILLSQNVSELQKLTAPDGASSKEFGNSVSIDGDYAVVASYQNDAGGTNRGSVFIYIYDHDSTKWDFIKQLTANDKADDDEFGISVSLTGNVLVVGAHKEADNGLNSGSAYIFYKDQGGTDNWGEVKRINASNAAVGDKFGTAVSISGDLIVVGAPLDDNGNGDGAGSAYVFSKDQGGTDNWGEVKNIIASDGTGEVSFNPGDEFGRSVSISGNTIVVGAPYQDTNGTDAGKAYVFSKDVGGTDNWGEAKTLLSTTPGAGDEFGNAVSNDGDLISVAAFKDDVTTAGGLKNDRGSVTIFSKDQGGADNWGEVKTIYSATSAFIANNRFGNSISMSGDNIIVGEAVNDNAYTFSKDQGGTDSWGYTRILRPNDFSYGDDFGYAVAASGDLYLASSVSDGNGSAYAFGFDSISPNTPSNFTATALATGTQVTFKWNQINDYHILYKIYVGTEPNPDTYVAGVYEKDSVVYSGLLPNTLYYARITSQDNGNNESVYSEDITFTLTDQTAPNIPHSLIAVGNNESVDLEWDSTPDGDFSSYNIYVGTSSNPTTQYDSTSDTELKIYGLEPSTQYYFRVTKLDTNGNESDYSDEATATTTALPVEPGRLRATHPSGGTLTLTWNDYSSIETGFTVERSVGDMSNFATLISVAADIETTDDSGLSDTTFYFYRVKSFNGSGNGNYSNIITVYTPSQNSDPSKFVEVNQFLGENAGDGFGTFVETEGDYVVIAAPDYDYNGFTNNGSAYLYKKNESDVLELVKLINPPASTLSKFGWSISMFGDRLAIGSQKRVYIYEKDEGGTDNWGLVKEITDLNNGFSQSISLFGDRVAVANPYVSSNRGQINVYEKDEGGTDNWGQKQILLPFERKITSYFGWSLSMSGSQLIVGVPHYYKEASGTRNGAAYVFLFNGSEWYQEQEIYGENDDQLGYSVSISGGQAIVGAHGAGEDGEAYILTLENNWDIAATLKPSEAVINGGGMGYSVSINGDNAIASNPWDNIVYVYSRNEGGEENWGQVNLLNASNKVNGNFFGSSISISPTRVVVGENYNDETASNAGASYVFEVDVIAPDPVVLMTDEILPEEVQISWTTSDATDFSHYIIYGDTLSNAMIAIDTLSTVTDSLFSLTSLLPNKMYYYSVSVTDQSGNESLYSNEIIFTSSAIAKSPSNLFSSDTTTSSVQLHWIDNSALEASYVIERSEDDQFNTYESMVTDSNVETFKDSLLLENKYYFYRVAAVNSNGDPSEYSNIISIKTLYIDTIAPIPVNLNSIEIEGYSISFNWSKSEEGDFKKYLIYSGTDVNTTMLVDSVFNLTDTTMTLLNLDEGETYFVRIQVADTNGNHSDFSNELSAYIVDTTAPEAPYLFPIVYNNSNTNYITVNQAQEEDFGQYKLYVSPYNEDNYVLTDSNSNRLDTVFTYTNTNYDAPSTQYRFKVTTSDLSGNESEFSYIRTVDLREYLAPEISTVALIPTISGTDIAITYFLFSNEELRLDDNNRPSVTATNGAVGTTYFELFDSISFVYKVDLLLDETRLGNISLSIRAFDLFRNHTTIEDQITINIAKRNKNLTVQLNEKIKLEFTKNTFMEDALITAQQLPSKDEVNFLEDMKQLEIISKAFSFNSNKSFLKNGILDFDLNSIMKTKEEKRKIGLYRKNKEGTWRFVSGYGNESFLKAKFDQDGIYGIFYNENMIAIPESFALQQNFPNPFNPVTTIQYQLPLNSHVSIVVYNVLGQKIKSLMKRQMEAGYHNIQWNGTNELGVKVSSGVYFYRIQFGSKSITKKMMLIK